MEESKNSEENKNEENLNSNEAAIAEPTVSPASFPTPQTPKKSKKKLLLIILLALLLLGGSAAAYFKFFKKKPAKQEQSTQQQAETEKAKKLTSFIYAYKEGKVTNVRRYTVADSTKKDVLKFNETVAVSTDGNYYSGLTPAADSTDDGKTLAYIEENNLNTYDVDANTSAKIIKKTGETGSADAGTLSIQFDPAITGSNSGPESITGLFGPQWSEDEEVIGFIGGRYEGATGHIINPDTKNFPTLGDTFIYVDEAPVKDKFVINSGMGELKSHGVLASRLLKPPLLQSYVFSSDKNTIYGVLCALDLPNSGNSEYLESAFSAQEKEDQKYRRDCGEITNKELVAVNLSDGKFSALADDQFAGSAALSGDNLYGALNTNGNFAVAVVNKDTKAKTTIDVLTIAGVEKAKALGTTVQNTERPVAELAHKDGTKFYVTVIDLIDKAKLATLQVEQVSAFVVIATVLE